MAFQQANPYQAYSVATRTVPKIRQVVMLYDGAIRFVKQAKDAIRQKQIEDRFKLLVRASQIMVGLRSSIDYEQGGEVAHTLEHFYTSMDVRILSVNFAKQDGESLCEAIITDLKAMRDVWDTIDRNLNACNDEGASQKAPHVENAQIKKMGVTLSA